MKISELLEKLGELQGEHGDCQVFTFHESRDCEGWDETRDPDPKYEKKDEKRKYCDEGVWL